MIVTSYIDNINNNNGDIFNNIDNNNKDIDAVHNNNNNKIYYIDLVG